MSWTLIWQPPAIDDLRRMDRQAAERVRAAVRRYASTGTGDVRMLKGQGGELRLRVSDWRVRFLLDRASGEMQVLRVLPRDQAYRR